MKRLAQLRKIEKSVRELEAGKQCTHSGRTTDIHTYIFKVNLSDAQVFPDIYSVTFLKKITAQNYYILMQNFYKWHSYLI